MMFLQSSKKIALAALCALLLALPAQAQETAAPETSPAVNDTAAGSAASDTADSNTVDGGLVRPGDESAGGNDNRNADRLLSGRKKKKDIDDVDPREEFKALPEGLLIAVDQHTRAQMQDTAKSGGSQQQSASLASINAVSIENEMALYNKGDYLKAFEALLPIARKGHAAAQETVGLMFRIGQGVPKDPVKAFQWFNRAAEQGRPLAQHHMSSMLFNGEGVAKDAVKSMMWIMIAEKNYQNDEKRRRAAEDRNAISNTLSRRERDRAEALAHDLMNTINNTKR